MRWARWAWVLLLAACGAGAGSGASRSQAVGAIEAAAGIAVAAPSGPALDAAADRFIAGQLPELLVLYRELHRHPELSLEEVRTAARVASELRAAGFAVTENVGGRGVVGLLDNGDGPTLLVRTDLDALPIAEQTDLEYASADAGRMHACGHDIHMSVFVGAARALAHLKASWRGRLVFVGQPAEELGLGALAMIEDGLFERFPRPDHTLALHVDANLAAGSVGLCPGWATANVDTVDITVPGRGGHGARPHQAVNPIVTAAHLVVALQTIVSRRVDPIEDAVVTVGALQAGTKHNVIPGEARLKLTVRTYTDEVRALVLREIERIAEHTCKAHGCPAAPLVALNARDAHTPAGYNDPAVTAAARRLFVSLLGARNVVDLRPAMVGEDFGQYGRRLGVPSLMFRLGTVKRARFEAAGRGEAELPGLHSPFYAPDPELSVRTGVRAMTALVLSLLARAESDGAAP